MAIAAELAPAEDRVCLRAHGEPVRPSLPAETDERTVSLNMPDIRDIDANDSLADVDKEMGHTETCLQAGAVTAELAAPFTALRAKCVILTAQQKELQKSVILADARAITADHTLDLLSEDTKIAVLAAYKNDYSAPLYRQLCAGERPSEFRRPVLGDQLAAMRDWPGPLAAAEVAALSALADQIRPAVVEADAITSEQALTTQALDTFDTGPLSDFVSECNAARKLVRGKLGELVHQRPDLRLPKDFQDRFFLFQGGAKAVKAEDLERAITRTRAKLAKLEARLQTLKEKQARAIREKQARALELRKAKLAAAEKRRAEAEAELAALTAEIEAAEAAEG